VHHWSWVARAALGQQTRPTLPFNSGGKTNVMKFTSLFPILAGFWLKPILKDSQDPKNMKELMHRVLIV